MSNEPAISLTLGGHAKINVTDSIHLMTRFVLEEQGDWFEDELPFVRSFLESGMRAIDIGANVGCYALSMAAAVGSKGHVWAFEPCAGTFDLLKSSATLNNFNHLSLTQAGLSEFAGQATLYHSANSELNSLHPKANRQQHKETIELLTLDDCKNRFTWDNIDFLKLDAEGEERNIIKGGQSTFSELSPLVMFELKHGGEVHEELIEDFAKLGYDSYTLNKSMNLLLPFSRNEIEAFQLNVFCCKPDMAQKLFQRGLLSFERPQVKEVVKDYSSCLDLIKNAMNSSNEKLERLSYWQVAYRSLTTLREQQPDSVAFTCASVRCALELGQRREAVILNRHLNALTKNGIVISPNETLIAPLPRYDNKDKPEEWLRMAGLEAYVTYHAHSCYFSGEHTSEILKEFNNSAYTTPAMQNRERAIHNRYL